MRRTTQFALFILVLVAVRGPFARGAETGGSIEGVVKNRSGEPVFGALIQFRNETRGVAMTAISRENGRYKRAGLPPGKYAIESFGGGFQSSPATAEVDGGRPVRLNLALTSPADFKKTASMAEFATLLPDGEAKTIMVSLCTDCHKNGLQEILFARKSRQDWDKTVELMRNHPYRYFRSLEISEPQKEKVLDYLAEHYGPGAPPVDLSKMPRTLFNGPEANSVVTEFDLPAGSEAHDVAVDSKGIGWVAEGAHGVIGRFDPQTFEYSRSPLPEGKSGATAIAVDSQDRIWLGDSENNRLVQYDPAKKIFTSFPLPAPPGGGRANVNTIRFHPDGTVWATGISSNQIYHLHPATKKVDAYDVPSGVILKENVNPYGMAIAPNSAVWFAERRSDKVAKVDPQTGHITEYDVPTKGAVLRRMAADNDGNLWFGEFGGIGKLAVADYRTGTITEYSTPTRYSGAYSVDVDRSRNLIWVMEMMADRIARFDPRTKTFVEYPILTRNSSVRRIEVDPSRPSRVWYSGLAVDKVGFLEVVE